MFMGHLGIALGAKGFRRDLSLVLLCLAAVGPDLIDFAIEGSKNTTGAGLWTHSLVSMFCYAVILFAVYALTTHQYKAALVLGFVAASHVLVDLITSHMVIWPGGPPLGLHLYLHRLADLLLESTVVLVGWFWYLHPARQAPAVDLFNRHSPGTAGYAGSYGHHESLVKNELH